MRNYPLTYNEFKDGLVDGKLLGLKCLDCGEVIIPPNAVCISCGSPKLEVSSCSRKGNIRTFTVIRVGPIGFDAPYMIALVELEDGPWVMGNVLGIDPDAADMDLIGKEVSLGYKILPREDPKIGVEGVVLTFKPVD